ncbi:unnamed protein product [Medioppia subpectinata]|uniref:CAF17 C-terminal domain-containing protein n=1 Tax=Medioppia subpectinata TaxID=1979941 RepID=A0A7R9L4I5_9ACAR|nr:unnamed protein product [Medioppia subpectinata]CAG2114255.1 unnamed protein product [Medioppia subpectinata]
MWNRLNGLNGLCCGLCRRQSSVITAKSVRKSHFYAIKLTNKRLVRVSGAESFIYLQSLLTNDLRHLSTAEEVVPRSAVYAFMLSGLGRVLADLFLYKAKLLSAGELILEVDSSLASALRRLLIGYNTNRNITVEAVNDIDLWALIPKTYDKRFNENNDFFLPEVVSDDFQLVADPRIPQMGYRLLTRMGGKRFDDILKYIADKRIEEGTLGHYRTYRYRLGVSEGFDDLLSGFYYPFELNGDYLNAISVNKGLYTSEEKTIKVYMKAPIIKRVVPIEFLCSESEVAQHSPPPSTLITCDRNKQMGFLRNRKGVHGIACLKVLNYKSPVWYKSLIHTQSGLPLKTWIPEWWPERVDAIYLPQVDYPQNMFHVIPAKN